MTDISALQVWLGGVIGGRKQPKALVVFGAQASGKTLFARTLMGRVGNTECVVADHVPENFNGLMVEKSLVVFDEFRGDIDRLKPYITEPTIEVERIGWTPVTQDNRTNYLLLVNNDPRAAFGDGRHFMVTTPLLALAALASLK